MPGLDCKLIPACIYNAWPEPMEQAACVDFDKKLIKIGRVYQSNFAVFITSCILDAAISSD
jgi:hypothetical protein